MKTNNPQGQNCGACKFSMPMQGAMICRRFPPTAIVAQVRNTITKETEMQTQSVFPPVLPDDCWCGEFAMRIHLSS